VVGFIGCYATVDNRWLCELAGQPESGVGCGAGQLPDPRRALADGRIRDFVT